MDSGDPNGAAENLIRLHIAVASGKPLDPSLGSWALKLIRESMSKSDRAAQRNRYLCAAADMMTGHIEAKAREIRTEAMVLQRVWTRRRDELPNIRTAIGCVHAAMQIDPDMPTSVIQLRRIITNRCLWHSFGST
jgi:hypothetical protein